jgi:hypothetical protein
MLTSFVVNSLMGKAGGGKASGAKHRAKRVAASWHPKLIASYVLEALVANCFFIKLSLMAVLVIKICSSGNLSARSIRLFAMRIS